MSTNATRPVPRPTPETAHYWKGIAERKILLQHCTPCDKTCFPPRSFCPHCGSDAVEVVEASGKATLYSFVISRARVPEFERPYCVGIAELEEGPRLMTQIVDSPADPEQLLVDMALEPVFFDAADGVTLLHFRPKR
ncbi:Zn-ribbon domain-containing OB-fold protein [Pseudohoeflea coraliihabitans]|uniref:Zn-ribbon domain-containing OB-fold protein n=1 Tax=Pseudohoeflea coraliihabitans TaxID=2860393 RepID=A0ABS6WSN0_9HYPH|nr:Zn-ribbon domain-containing OB-fold protein [Pseudohoeflea sp. DP4N28-3]MBW3098974.1 Zn-ribbon domain-containing OB-fold protein [Pseudohoeflea sp. DP4N28-3]